MSISVEFKNTAFTIAFEGQPIGRIHEAYLERAVSAKDVKQAAWCALESLGPNNPLESLTKPNEEPETAGELDLTFGDKIRIFDGTIAALQAPEA